MYRYCDDSSENSSFENAASEKQRAKIIEPYIFDGHRVRCVIAQPSPQLLFVIEGAALNAGLEVVGLCTDAHDMINTIVYEKPDVTIVHGMFPQLSYQAIIERLDSTITTKYPAVIFNLPSLSAKAYGVSEHCLYSPYDPNELRRLIAESLPLPARPDIIERAKALLRRMGIPERPALNYLAHAAALVFNNALDMRRMSDYISPTIADAYNTNARAAVEAMRRAIDTAWTKGDIDRQYDYFKNTINPEKGKPTCVELIAMTAEILRCNEDLRTDKQ